MHIKVEFPEGIPQDDADKAVLVFAQRNGYSGATGAAAEDHVSTVLSDMIMDAAQDEYVNEQKRDIETQARSDAKTRFPKK